MPALPLRHLNRIHNDFSLRQVCSHRVENTHEAIISEEVFQKVQELIAGRRRKDNSADSFPFDSAVNVAEVKMFIPEKRELNENIKKSLRTVSDRSLSDLPSVV